MSEERLNSFLKKKNDDLKEDLHKSLQTTVELKETLAEKERTIAVLKERFKQDALRLTQLQGELKKAITQSASVDHFVLFKEQIKDLKEEANTLKNLLNKKEKTVNQTQSRIQSLEIELHSVQHLQPLRELLESKRKQVILLENLLAQIPHEIALHLPETKTLQELSVKTRSEIDSIEAFIASESGVQAVLPSGANF